MWPAGTFAVRPFLLTLPLCNDCGLADIPVAHVLGHQKCQGASLNRLLDLFDQRKKEGARTLAIQFVGGRIDDQLAHFGMNPPTSAIDEPDRLWRHGLPLSQFRTTLQKAPPRPAGALALRYRAGSFPHISLVTAEGRCSDTTLHYITSHKHCTHAGQMVSNVHPLSVVCTVANWQAHLLKRTRSARHARLPHEKHTRLGAPAQHCTRACHMVSKYDQVLPLSIVCAAATW